MTRPKIVILGGYGIFGSLIAEQLGMAGPKRWTWTLRGRATPGNILTNYSVIQRNFDPFTYKPNVKPG